MAPLPPPQGMSEHDYETIEAAVTETVRGRWFLGEFARRNRTAELRQLLDATGEVVHAQSLADAKQKLVILDPALVVLDIGLADGSGLSLLPLLADARGRRIPSIVFSAQIPETPLVEGVDVVLPKTRASLERLSVEADRLVRRGRDAEPRAA